MYLGPEIIFLLANVMKNRADMYTVLASHAMVGQLTEKRTSTLEGNI